jgi:hypothetical protein
MTVQCKQKEVPLQLGPYWIDTKVCIICSRGMVLLKDNQERETLHRKISPVDEVVGPVTDSSKPDNITPPDQHDQCLVRNGKCKGIQGSVDLEA